MNKRLQDAINYLDDKREHLQTKKGNQLVAIASGVGAFAIGLITVVLVAVIIAALQASASVGAYTVNNTAWIIANNTLTMMANFSNQLGLAGTVLGFVVIFGGLAYLGYFAYNKATAGR